MSVDLEYNDNVMIAYLSGDIDHHRATDVRVTLDESLQNVRPSVLKLDFEKVPFMDSSGIGLILGRVRLMRHWNGRIILCNISDDISKMAKIAGLFNLVSEDRRLNFEK